MISLKEDIQLKLLKGRNGNIHQEEREMVTFLKLTSLQNYIFITLEEKESKDNRKWVNNKSSRGKPMQAISFKMEFVQGVTIFIETLYKNKKIPKLSFVIKSSFEKKSKCKIRK